MATLDDAAFGAATKVTPKFVSPSDPASQWTGAMRGPAFFAYSDNYLIDVKVGIIMDVEASRSVRQAEVGASKTMIERTQERFDIKPERLAGDTAYGSGANLNWLVKDKDIAPHIPVIDKSKREDGTFSREDFTFDEDRNVYICPANKILTTTGKLVNDGETLLYRTKARDCRGCLLKAQCCPKTSVRKIPRSIYEEARDVARALAKTEAFKQSSRVSCGSAGYDCAGHAVPSSSSRWQRLRRTFAGLPSSSPGHHRSPLCALRKRCKSVKSSVSRPHNPAGDNRWLQKNAPAVPRQLYADFCNKIGTKQTY
jgi:Pyruvate/2-oxoacid:ferredoxin oxidoreductase delta subunit